MQARIIRSSTELRQLLPEWQHLFEADPRASARNGPLLVVAFHEMFTPEILPRVVVAQDADGTLRGVLPLGLRVRRVGPVLLRGLVPLIGPHAYHFDAIADPEFHRAAGVAIAEGLGRIDRDWLELRHLRPDARLLDPDAGVLGSLVAPVQHRGVPSHRVRLGSGETIRGRDAREMSRLARQLDATGNIVMGWEAPGAALLQTLADLVELHTRLKRWQRQNMVFLQGSAARDFPPWLAAEVHAGRARVFTIRRDGRLLAGSILLCSHGTAHSYRAAWDPDDARFGLGILITTRVIEACRLAGFTTFDLGPGTEPYKAKWHPEVDTLTDLRETRATLRHHVAQRWLRLRGRSSPE